MQITTFKTENYRGCPVYYRNFYHHFEYLTVVEGQLYTAHLTVNPALLTNLIYWVGIEKLPYSQQQLKVILTQLQRLAQTTIDFVLDKEKQ